MPFNVINRGLSLLTFGTKNVLANYKALIIIKLMKTFIKIIVLFFSIAILPNFCLAAQNQTVQSIANYIISIQEPSGAIPDAFDNTFYNQDNDSGYALTGLFYAYKLTGDTKYLQAIKNNLAWMASLQESDGAWHWAYSKQNGKYLPITSQYYQGQGITDIKNIDAIQSYFAYNLWLFALSGQDPAFVKQMIPKAKKGLDILFIKNYDPKDGLFYSSWQLKNNQWQRLDIKYSSGQADAYLGLMSIYKLTGDKRYFNTAQHIKNNFDYYFWDSIKRNYVVGIDKNGKIKTEYLMTQGYPAFVFKNKTSWQQWGLYYLAKNQQYDGSIKTISNPQKETLFSAFLALGDISLNMYPYHRQQAIKFIKSMQMPNGGIKMSNQYPYLYTNIAGFSIMALSQDNTDYLK